MISYRDNLKKIGIHSGKVSYRDFISRPDSLRQAIRSMSVPEEFKQVTETHVDKRWTEECQGVTWDGKHWVFTSNGSGSPFGDSPKAIYAFTSINKPTNPSHFMHFTSIPTPPSGKLYHIGAVIYHKGLIYIDHWNNSGGQEVAILKHSSQKFSFLRWVSLDSVRGKRVGLIGINPWDETFYTSFGDTNIDRVFIHDSTGNYTGREMLLSPGIKNGGYAQGGVFSPNGHLYIASGKKDIGYFQFIYCYSALNGKLLHKIPVLTKRPGDELEGLCYAEVKRNSKHAQLHVVLLENINIAKDNIFFKSFAASEPDLV